MRQLTTTGAEATAVVKSNDIIRRQMFYIMAANFVSQFSL